MKPYHWATVRPFVRRRCDCSASLAPFTNIQTYLLTYLLTGHHCCLSNKKLSWCWQRARRVCRSVEVNKHFGSIPSKI